MSIWLTPASCPPLRGERHSHVTEWTLPLTWQSERTGPRPPRGARRVGESATLPPTGTRPPRTESGNPYSEAAGLRLFARRSTQAAPRARRDPLASCPGASLRPDAPDASRIRPGRPSRLPAGAKHPRPGRIYREEDDVMLCRRGHRANESATQSSGSPECAAGLAVYSHRSLQWCRCGGGFGRDFNGRSSLYSVSFRPRAAGSRRALAPAGSDIRRRSGTRGARKARPPGCPPQPEGTAS